MPRTIAVLLTAILAALALGACGGDDGGDASTTTAAATPTTADFRTQYAPVSTEIRELGVDVGAAVEAAKAKTDAQLQAQFSELAERTSTAAAHLAATVPPADAKIKAARLKLIAGVKQGASDLAAISAAASLSDAKAARAATVALVEHSANIRDPRLELDRLVLSSN